MRLLLLSLLLPVCIKAQNLDGVWGLKWGISTDSAISLIQSSKGCTPQIRKSGNSTTLIYYNVPWGYETSTVTKLQFYEEKLYSSTAFFIPEKEEQLIKVYNTLKNTISEKYFAPQKDVEEYKQVFSKEDPDKKKGYAILNGFASIGCTWSFKKLDSLSELITLNATKSAGIILSYADGNISSDLAKQTGQKIKNDF